MFEIFALLRTFPLMVLVSVSIVRKEALSFSLLYHLLFPPSEKGEVNWSGNTWDFDEVLKLLHWLQV
jgi:hypothetical protein